MLEYIMEEFICGHVETFDGITDANKNILISSSHVYAKFYHEYSK